MLLLKTGLFWRANCQAEIKMPFTFAHPAAVLPLKKYCPKYLNLPALVIGSLMPDLGYYMHNWVWSICGHSFAGSLTFDVPAGFVLLSLFYLNIRSVARLLPYPHREALSAICPAITLPGFRAIFIAAVSLLLGAWTHIIWDGFTHANGWCVREFASVTPTLFILGGRPVTIWHLLQHCSTVFGLTLLIIDYMRHIHSRRFLRHNGLLGQKTRTAIWIMLLTLPAVRAAVDNAEFLRRGINLLKIDEFIFNATVSYFYIFLPLVCATGIVISVLEYLFLSRKPIDMSVPWTDTKEKNDLQPVLPPDRTILSVLASPGKTASFSE